MKTGSRFIGLFCTLWLLYPAVATGQALLPPQGEFYLGFHYQMLDARTHLFSRIVEAPERTPLEQFFDFDFPSKVDQAGEKIQSQVLDADVDVGITDRLALSGAISFVEARYVGDFPDAPEDDGNWHGSFQDIQIGARYLAVKTQFWALTPFANARFPTNDYPILGHSARGTGLSELQVGTYLGRLFTLDGVARFYLQGAYSYAFMENVSEQVKLDRSDVQFELAFLHGPLTVQLSTAFLKVHGGIQWHQIGAEILDSGLSFDAILEDPTLYHTFHAHDRAAAAFHWNLGGGLSFQIAETLDMYVAINDILWGENTHGARTVNFGLSWGLRAFGGVGRTRIPRDGS